MTKHFLSKITLLGSLAILPPSAEGAVSSWQTPAGNWDVAANWTGSSVPVSTGTAIINNSGTVFLPAGVTGTVTNLRIGNDPDNNPAKSGALSISGGGLTSSSAIVGSLTSGTAFLSSGTWNAGALTVGYQSQGGAGVLNITGGTLSTSGAGVGIGTYDFGTHSGTGTVNVSGGVWNAGSITVGAIGSGFLNISGGVVSGSSTRIGGDVFPPLGGSSSDNGSVLVSGGTWNAGSLTLGPTANARVGNGSVTITGGVVNSNGASLGVGSFSSGGIGVSGGTWNNTGGISLGSRGGAGITVSGSGAVNTGSVQIGEGFGSITLSGSAGARGVLSTSKISNFGTRARLTFDGGVLRATADSSDFLVNFLDPASSTVTINQGGAYLDTNGHAVAVLAVFGGTGKLTKVGSGTLTMSGSSNYAGGTSVEAGTLKVSNANALGTGSVQINGGGVLQVDAGVALGLGAGQNITVADDGASAYVKDFSAGEALNRLNTVTSAGVQGTQFKILNGTAAVAMSLSAAFSTSPSSPAVNDFVRISDVLNFEGSGAETFVMQLSYTQAAYDAVAANGFLGSENELTIGYLSGGEWVDLGTGTFIEGAWNSSYTALGTYGVDTLNNTVWVVTNHNSEFAIIPEPAPAALLLGVASWILFACGRRRPVEMGGA